MAFPLHYRCDAPDQLGRHSVCFVTLGCAKNEADTQKMRDIVCSAGYALVDEPSLADAIVVNTCSFIQAATEESLDAIFELLDSPAVRKRNVKLIVCGCMPSRYGSDLSHALKEVNLFLPCEDEDTIADVLHAVFGSVSDHPVSDTHILSSAAKQFRYVKISEGCDRFCSFCTIPHIRGRYHSFSLPDIEADVLRAENSDAKEVILIAQDTGVWGSDFSVPSRLAELLHTLAVNHSGLWFRVLYVQPEGISDALLDVMAAYPNICNYLDIPLQHCDKDLLDAMHRRGSYEDYLSLVDRIRTRIPGVTLRTTLMAGFPGESDEQFESLCAFVRDVGFDYVGVFPYSQEENTPAANLPGQIPEEEKLRRAQILRDCADEVSFKMLAHKRDTFVDVLVEGTDEEGRLYGRAQCQAPDVDGITYLDIGDIGTIVHAKILDTVLYDMEGRFIQPLSHL